MSHRFYPATPVGFIRKDRRNPEQYDYDRSFVTSSRPYRGPLFLDSLIDPRRTPSLFRGFGDHKYIRHLSVKPVYYNTTDGLPHRPMVTRPCQVVEKVPFARAMRRLHSQVGKAEDFYRQFQIGFDTEIAAIKPYATREICCELWLLKAGRVGSNRRNSSCNEGVDNDLDLPQRISELFGEWQEKVMLAMHTATDAKLGESPSPSRKVEHRLDSKRRLQRKVEVSGEHINDLLQQAAEDREGCKALLNELEALRALVDPNDKKNFEVYKSIGDDGFDDEDDK